MSCATVWLSSTINVFTEPSNIFTRNTRCFFLYSSRSWHVHTVTAKYCDQRVCLFVCLSACEHISGTTRTIFMEFFVHVNYAVDWSSSDATAISYVLAVLWMTSASNGQRQKSIQSVIQEGQQDLTERWTLKPGSSNELDGESDIYDCFGWVLHWVSLYKIRSFWRHLCFDGYVQPVKKLTGGVLAWLSVWS